MSASVNWLNSSCLVGVLEVLGDEVGDIRVGVQAQEAEEIIGGGDPAAHLRQVILDEGKENLIPDAAAQILQEVRAI